MLVQTHWIWRVYFYGRSSKKISEKWQMAENPVFAMIEPRNQGR